MPILPGYRIFVTIVAHVRFLYDGLTLRGIYSSQRPAAHLFSLILVSLTLNKENLWHFGHRIYLFFPNLILVRDANGTQLYSNSWLHFGHLNLLFIDGIIICNYLNLLFSDFQKGAPAVPPRNDSGHPIAVGVFHYFSRNFGESNHSPDTFISPSISWKTTLTITSLGSSVNLAL